MTMIFVPESIERTLERIVEVFKRDIKKGRAYYSSIERDGVVYTGTDTVRIQLEDFEEFKTSLENGTSELLLCEKGKEDEAKVRLMHTIWDYYAPLSQDDKYWVENDVYIQRGLKARLKRLSTKSETRKEALSLLEFLNNAHASSWDQGDAHYKIRNFRFVDSEEEFEEILSKFDEAEELKADKKIVNFTTIRVAWIPVDCMTIYKKKGIYEEYLKFCEEHLGDINFHNGSDMFNLWHDVRETAIYYVFAPQVKK